MLRRYAVLLLLLLLGPPAARAQTATFGGFEYRAAGAVVEGADTLRQAWAGGFNTPQFSSIDLNGDGRNDLFAFDRQTSRCYTFLNAAQPGGSRGWQYAPDYEALFPQDLAGWALLRDYDCDGRPDLFSYVNGGDIRVHRNVAGAGGRPSFQLTTSQLRFSGAGTGTSNLTIGGYNMPSIADVNGDGKLDILSYDFVSATRIELYLNTSADACGAGLTYKIDTNYWAQLQTCSGCAAYQLPGLACRGGGAAAKPTHTGGHNLLVLDVNGDGVYDVLDGRDNCPELVALLNQGTNQLATLTASSIRTDFPSAANPVRLPVFPAGYLIDTDFDGINDLVVAPNMLDNSQDNVSQRDNVRLYRNTAATGAPAFGYQPRGFLTNDVVDVSEAAAPTFGDLDGDGLADMLIGSNADRVNGQYRASLTYYRNVGTAARPVFSLVSRDYLGLAAKGTAPALFLALKPVLVDLNRDGALDLAYAANYQNVNRIYYILNTAAAGRPAVFDPTTTNYFKPQGAAGSGVLPAFMGDMPCFTDVDGDGNVDLLVGTDDYTEPGQSLRYFRNQGPGVALENAFVAVNNDLGRIRDAAGARPFHLSPAVADFDGDGLPDLVTADNTGAVRFFSNYRTLLAGPTAPRTNLFWNALLSQYEANRLGQSALVRYGLAAADVNADGIPELFIGTETGGLSSYAVRRGTPTPTRPPAAAALGLALYPNPARAQATAETAQPTRVSVIDATGRVVRAPGDLARQHALVLSGLAPGLYLVRAEAADGTAAVQRLAVQ
ncbi:T9SS type A sorting domain-containing protein [Hymenobacter sp. PAMC 26628]|uniref:T9SS type A sorting domain-containing protein n=1 Tax=Hymenobacter sp. PAMC 26628 TaxID=1484118 RepID=UPI0007700311|nr:T9SS type A sorting domain-containing protein [Hymenobacter sp. PAMC 26628]AMJ64325.1 hypothetical protein AXW84_01950 [Hymenobacter sp. PAMC 26628]